MAPDQRSNEERSKEGLQVRDRPRLGSFHAEERVVYVLGPEQPRRGVEPLVGQLTKLGRSRVKRDDLVAVVAKQTHRPTVGQEQVGSTQRVQNVGTSLTVRGGDETLLLPLDLDEDDGVAAAEDHDVRATVRPDGCPEARQVHLAVEGADGDVGGVDEIAYEALPNDLLRGRAAVVVR